MNRPIWQISAGPANRSYADVFLSYGVGLIGPGDSGPWKLGEEDARFEGGFVRRFASEMQIGDVVVLRTGVDRIRAVGVVASDYQYLESFDDVNGWDLQHARRVRWQRLPEEYVFSGGVFGSNAARCSRVRNEEVVDYARRFVGSGLTRWQEAPLPTLPPVDAPLEEGAARARRRRRPWSATWRVSTETRSGWGTRRPRTRRSRISSFRSFGRLAGRRSASPSSGGASTWRSSTHCLARPRPAALSSRPSVLAPALEGARKQAKAYVETLGVPREVVVTDGFRYRMFSCEGDFAPVAYTNLARLKESATDLFTRLRRP